MKFLKNLTAILIAVGILTAVGCGKEANNKLPIRTRSGAGTNVKAGELDPATKKKVDELYSESGLIAYKTELGKEANFSKMKELARTSFATLINLGKKVAPPQQAQPQTNSKAQPQQQTGKKIGTKRVQVANEQKNEEWKGVRVIEVLTKKDEVTRYATEMKLVLALEGDQTVNLTGKFASESKDIRKIVAKLTGVAEPSNEKFAKVEAMVLCITESCNQVLSLIKLDETNYKVVLTRAIDAELDPKSPGKVTQARVDIHSIVNSDQQEMMIYFTHNSTKVSLAGAIAVKDPTQSDRYQFRNRSEMSDVVVGITTRDEKGFKRIIIDPDKTESRIVLILSKQDPNNETKEVSER